MLYENANLIHYNAPNVLVRLVVTRCATNRYHFTLNYKLTSLIDSNAKQCVIIDYNAPQAPRVCTTLDRGPGRCGYRYLLHLRHPAARPQPPQR